jgi:hypothetical protein
MTCRKPHGSKYNNVQGSPVFMLTSPLPAVPGHHGISVSVHDALAVLADILFDGPDRYPEPSECSMVGWISLCTEEGIHVSRKRGTLIKSRLLTVHTTVQPNPDT